MKLIVYILSICILSIGTSFCNDFQQTEHQTETSVNIAVDSHVDSDSEHQDECTTTCVCSCCGLQISVTKQKPLLQTQIPFYLDIHSNYLFNYNFTLSDQLIEPPKNS